MLEKEFVQEIMDRGPIALMEPESDNQEPAQEQQGRSAESSASPAAPVGQQGEQAPEGAPGVQAQAGQRSDDLYSEYGIGSFDTENLDYYRAQSESMASRIHQLESELEASHARVGNKLSYMTEADINDEVGKLRDENKHAEAETMLRDWLKAKTSNDGQSTMQERMKRAQVLCAEYSQRAPAFKSLMSRPDVANRIKQFEGLINVDRPGGPEALHLVLVGMLAGEIARKSEEKGRMGVQMKPARSASTSAATAPSREPVGALRPRPTTSDFILRSGNRK